MRTPVQGQIVEVRQRRYVVSNVYPSQLPANPLKPDVSPVQNLVTLSSIEDDALGEQLRVVWEIEPGVRAYEKLSLPSPQDGFDDPTFLDAFLDAVRWGASSQADTRMLQAPFRSGIEIQDYQLDPLVRAVQMPRVNLLIADDVGLGKTIEAGLVLQELIIRHRVRRALILCPSSIQIQWKDQMRDKFGLDFRIVDSAMMRELRRSRGLQANPWSSFPRLIASIDFIKRDRQLRLFRETLPKDGHPTYPRKWDMLILDEAHNVAPSRAGKYATDSLRTTAIRTIVPHVEHKLFLSATPHNGYQESFTALLELLDSQRFARDAAPNKQQLGAVMVRRLKSELKDWDGAPRFPERKLIALEVDYDDGERSAHRLLRDYSKSRLENAADETERYATEFVLKLLKKRLISSPAAFASTLSRHRASIGSSTRKSSAHAKPSVGILRQQIDQVDEDYADDDLFDEATESSLDTATLLFRPPTSAEELLLDSLTKWAVRSAGAADSKARAMLDWLRSTLKPDGNWNKTRVIIFTEYRSTQKWLQQILTQEGFAANGPGGDKRLLLLYGGVASDIREKVKAAFQADPEQSAVRILLATDAASEGIDLQNHCARLIHYEIPWNPNRMEQRNGRVDRHGQRESLVQIFHFVGAGYKVLLASANKQNSGSLDADLEFLMRAATKVNNIREDLGKVGPVIAAQVEEAMLGKRINLDTEAAERAAEPVRRLLRLEYKLRDQIASFSEQFHESRIAMRFTPEAVLSVVRVGMQLAGKPPLREATLAGIWPDPTAKRDTCPVFNLPLLDGSWAPCADGLAHPHTQDIRPITFDHSISNGRDDVVLAHLGHRLVQMCLRLLRAELWASESKRGVHLRRVSARRVTNQVLVNPGIIAYGRLVVLGGDGQRLHEEIVTTCGEFKEGAFKRLSATQGQAVVNAAYGNVDSEQVLERLASLWPRNEKHIESALKSRAADRFQTLRRTLDERADKEILSITSVLTELANTIRQELLDPSGGQLELGLYSDTERKQWERNVGSLRSRVAEIPAEIEKETSAIRVRFAKPIHRMFPIAISFVIPEKLSASSGAKQ